MLDSTRRAHEAWSGRKLPQDPAAGCRRLRNSTEEVAEIVKLVPSIISRSSFRTGTSLEGHIGAVTGGICINLSAMN